MRKVFLEDAVYRQEKYPDFPAYKHRVFNLPQWKVYAEAEKKRVAAREAEWKQKDADLLFKVNELQQGQVDTSAALQGLNDKLDQLVQNGVAVSEASGTAPEAPQEAPLQESTPTLPLPALPKTIADIREFYITWHNNCRHQYIAHKATHCVFKWKDIYGSDFQVYKLRYYKAEPFLSFLDGLDDSQSSDHDSAELDPSSAVTDDVGFSRAVDEALTIMEKFIEMNAVSPASFVKSIFYNMVKVEMLVKDVVRKQADDLRAQLSAGGFDVPLHAEKQNQAKKRKPVTK
jgi:hypothetical protein